MIDAEVLKDSAFDVVASHVRFPRFRLELDEGLGWKVGVESALEKLVVMAAIDLVGRERLTVPAGSRSGARNRFKRARES
ncbi:putative acetyltransferase [Mycobacteroides abscessus subsp. abscessus]|nr:putative acetyltransferase [Mycobacteroides abscessus subsp. abscessus]